MDHPDLQRAVVRRAALPVGQRPQPDLWRHARGQPRARLVLHARWLRGTLGGVAHGQLRGRRAGRRRRHRPHRHRHGTAVPAPVARPDARSGADDHRLRGPALRVRGRHRRRPRQPPRGDGGQSPGRAARQLRQGALPRALVLHAVRTDGAHPGAPAHRPLRPRMMRRPGVLVGVAVVVVAAAAVAPWLPSYPLTLLTQAMIVAILAMSLDVLLGFTGLPSLGHAAYFGVAAYAVAILTTERQNGFVVCLIAGVVFAAVAAALFGLIAIRATGTYFLMITLALGMVVWGLAFRWVSLTKGDNGISGVPRPDLGLPWSFWGPLPFFYLSLVCALVALALLALIVASLFGMSLKGIRESESRMRILGYNVWLHKYLAFVIAGTFAGFSGVLWAYYNGFVSPVDVQLVTSVEALLMVALGGQGTLLGPAVGAALIVFLKNFVSVYTKRWLLILGAVYIGVILFAPRGLAGAFHRRSS